MGEPHPVVIRQLRRSGERTPPGRDQAIQIGGENPHPLTAFQFFRELRWSDEEAPTPSWVQGCDEKVSKCEGKVSTLQAGTPERQKIIVAEQGGQELRWLLRPPMIRGGMVCIDLCSPVSQKPINFNINLFVKKVKNVKQKKQPENKCKSKCQKKNKQKNNKKHTKKNVKKQPKKEKDKQ